VAAALSDTLLYLNMVLFFLTCIAYAGVALALTLAALVWYIRPFPISPDLPGPKRHWLLGVTFGDSEEFLVKESNNNKPENFDWNHWPSLSLAISRRFGFRTWGGPTLNIGFGGAFFNVGT
jgi:hypothetical protein